MQNYCDKCGAKLKEGAGFCQSCGDPISSVSVGSYGVELLINLIHILMRSVSQITKYSIKQSAYKQLIPRLLIFKFLTDISYNPI
ncbi:zinc ribbon domain-containing protein [Anaerocolumna jejuensis]|uniref:zinc ribbon domain-containing protein n=1 Tax=Anaerocolumna jejuensis TaxID=259063 RepID=UPI003F7C62F3